MEFAPHAAWLLTDPLLDPSNCECGYCSKKQRRKSTSVSSTTPVQTESHPSPIPSPRVQRHISPGPSHTRQSAPSQATQRSRSLRGVSREASFCKVLPQQEERSQCTPIPAQLSDLVAHTQGRIYRDKELVWYILDRPWKIPERSHSEINHSIRFWPGILRTTFCPRSHIASPHQSTENHQNRNSYLVTTPSLGRTYIVPRASIIPFQAHSLDEDFLVELQSKGTEIWLNDLDCEFDPSPRSSTLVSSLSQGIELETSPLDLLITDIRIAKQVACIWTVTDEFFTYLDPVGDVAPCSPTLPKAAAPLGRTLTRSSSFNSSSGKQIERWYRGLWWGAERIWAGDFLILSFSESMMGYTAASSSCFVGGTRPEDHINGPPPEEQREPENKHVFLKLKSLNKVGTHIWVVGDLYRLVPSLDTSPSLQQEDDLGLPNPPDGFAFGSMLSANVEAKLPIKLVRGRYYPRLHLSVDDRQSVPDDEQSVLDERMLKVMEGRSQTDPTIRRPTKYNRESRGSLLASVCSIRF